MELGFWQNLTRHQRLKVRLSLLVVNLKLFQTLNRLFEHFLSAFVLGFKLSQRVGLKLFVNAGDNKAREVDNFLKIAHRYIKNSTKNIRHTTHVPNVSNR